MDNQSNNTNHYYIIKSVDKKAGETEACFTVAPHQFNNVRSYKIQKVLIPYTFYPLNSNNNTFVFNEPGAAGIDISVIIPEGEYTLAQLKAQLKISLDASAGTGVFTITDNVNTHKITITSTVSYIYKGTVARINKYLGYNAIDTADALAHEADNIFQLSGTNCVEIYSNQLTEYDSHIRSSSNAGHNLLVRIPLSNYSFGDTILYEPDNQFFDYHPKAENNIDIELRDEDNKVLGGSSLLNGHDWSFELQFHGISNNHPNANHRL